MNAAPTDQGLTRERLSKGVISAFIVLYLVVVIAHLSPKDFALTRVIADQTNFLWKFSGIYQSWTLFSPKIRTMNSHTVAYVWFDNGAMTAFPLPRFEKGTSIYDKFRYDKFRKWHGDSMQWEWYKEFWPQLAKYVGRLHYDGTGPKPVSFALMCYKVEIPKPESNTPRSALPEHDSPYCSFFYRYRDGDLVAK
jgi:hypothetical protein